MDEAVTLPSLPFSLSWGPLPERWHAGEDGSLSAHAGALTDMFVSPQGDPPKLSAPRLLGVPAGGDFQLAARVTVDFAATFDAGVLLLYADEGAWAKLCYERSPQGEPLVVSVVTRGLSDDANAFAVPGGTVWLRVSRIAPAWAFHASTDGVEWQFVRHFGLEPSERMSVGFLAQSPTGDGCTVAFDEIRYRTERLSDMRGGV